MKIFAAVEPSQLSTPWLEALGARLAGTLRDLGHRCSQGQIVGFDAKPFSSAVQLPADMDGYSTFISMSLELASPLQEESFERVFRHVGLNSPLSVAEHVHTQGQLLIGPSDVVRIGYIARNPSLSAGEFRDHWISHHAPLVMAHAPLFHRYVSNIPTSETRWDGIVEQWFADEKIWLEHDRRIMEERPEVRADIPLFISSMAQYSAKPIECVSWKVE